MRVDVVTMDTIRAELYKECVYTVYTNTLYRPAYIGVVRRQEWLASEHGREYSSGRMNELGNSHSCGVL